MLAIAATHPICYTTLHLSPGFGLNKVGVIFNIFYFTAAIFAEGIAWEILGWLGGVWVSFFWTFITFQMILNKSAGLITVKVILAWCWKKEHLHRLQNQQMVVFKWKETSLKSRYTVFGPLD